MRALDGSDDVRLRVAVNLRDIVVTAFARYLKGLEPVQAAEDDVASAAR